MNTWRCRIIMLACLAAAFCGFAAHAAEPPVAAPKPDASAAYCDAGQFDVGVMVCDWTDAKRNRPVPARIYYPKTSAGPFPLIIFSHGLGGTLDGYEYLGRHWAGHGYVCVHPQHKGSDDEVWRNKPDPMKSMQKAVNDYRNGISRPKDVTFAIDQMEKLNTNDPVLKGRVDMKRIGVAGHSFGAYTALASAGQVFSGPLGIKVSFADPRVTAAIPMSAPFNKGQDPRKCFAKFATPCLHMTGTLDASPIGETSAEQRRIPYDSISGADQYLITFTGGDHMIFSGRGSNLSVTAKDAAFQRLIRTSSIAFWDAYLKDDAKAKAWLADGGCEKLLGKDGTFEKKLLPAK